MTALLALTLTGCGSGTPNATGESAGRAQPLQPYSAKAEERDIVGFETLNAELITPPASMAEIHPPYRAPLKRVLVTVGQRVRRGEVLMELDFPDAEAMHDQARTSALQAEQAYEGAKASLRAPLREAQRQLESARATERALRDRTDPSGDASALVDATNARQAAEAEVTRVQSEYQAALQPYALQLEEARSSERAARAGAKEASVRAPISGTVIELKAQAGQEVGQDKNEKLALIVDLDDMKLRADVPPTLTDDIDKGDEVLITFGEIPKERFTGYVRGVRTLPDGDRKTKVEVEIELRNNQGLVKPGMRPDRVAIQTDRADDVTAVPAESVDTDDTGRPFVRVLVDGEWKVRIVEPGVSDGEWTQIKKGIAEGETVQVTP
ncbi:MAG: efflux RND transporter periplasmic adaptor subunit [Fimbriimonas sp.]